MSQKQKIKLFLKTVWRRVFVTLNDKWNNFLKNGSVLAYLSYASAKKNALECEKKNETSNAGVNNKRNQCGRER